MTRRARTPLHLSLMAAAAFVALCAAFGAAMAAWTAGPAAAVHGLGPGAAGSAIAGPLAALWWAAGPHRRRARAGWFALGGAAIGAGIAGGLAAATGGVAPSLLMAAAAAGAACGTAYWAIQRLIAMRA